MRGLLEHALAADLTELDETDNLHAPVGPLAHAQRYAAEAWGAEETHFLVNGSTVGLQALVMAALAPGEAIALSRASHLAALGAVILAGGLPCFTGEGWDAEWELPASVGAVPDDVRVVLATRPNYFGWAQDLAPLDRWARERQGILLVDEAHGAHWGTAEGFPAPALSGGAHGVVQSTHKTAGALTQAAMLHLRGDHLDRARVRRMLRLLQTTSPSFLLLGSLDAARAARSATGRQDWQKARSLASELKQELAGLGLPCLGPDHGPPGSWDPTRVVMDLAACRLEGEEVAQYLHDHHALQVELATPRYVGLIVTPGHDAADLKCVVRGLAGARRDLRPNSQARPAVPPAPELAVLPREALLGPSRAVSLDRALGEVSAEFVCPYPPGLPALVPGERVSREVLEYLNALRARGATWVGPDDPALETLQVCTSIPSSTARAVSSS